MALTAGSRIALAAALLAGACAPSGEWKVVLEVGNGLRE
jgi:hypothetical protein